MEHFYACHGARALEAKEKLCHLVSIHYTTHHHQTQRPVLRAGDIKLSEAVCEHSGRPNPEAVDSSRESTGSMVTWSLSPNPAIYLYDKLDQVITFL